MDENPMNILVAPNLFDGFVLGEKAGYTIDISLRLMPEWDAP